MGRNVRRLPMMAVAAMTVGVVLGAAGALWGPAGAQVPGPPGQPAPPAGGPRVAGGSGVVEVIKVDGLLDPVMVDFVLGAIGQVEAEEAVGLVLQVDSPGAVVDEEVLGGLVTAMRTASVPVSVWIGPSGGTARGAAAVLGGHATYLGMAPGTTWGRDGVAVPAALLEGALRPVPDGLLTTEEADAAGLTSSVAPTIGDHIVDLPGVETREVEVGDETRREPVTTVVFSALPLVDSLMHAVASPAVAYLLVTVGMALLIFELFTAGVGIAGGVGAGSLLLGSYGLAALPVRWWAVALLVAAMVAFTVDVQTGVPRVWTGVGFALFVAGSLTLYDGVSMSWITLGVAFIGVALTFLSGIPSMVRTRFATPTIGREWMVGEMGRAVTGVDPDGVVQIRSALWRATTNRATPVAELDRVRVVGIDGLVLQVEPETGGGRDYRDRARGRPDGDAPFAGTNVDDAPPRGGDPAGGHGGAPGG